MGRGSCLTRVGGIDRDDQVHLRRRLAGDVVVTSVVKCDAHALPWVKDQSLYELGGSIVEFIIPIGSAVLIPSYAQGLRHPVAGIVKRDRAVSGNGKRGSAEARAGQVDLRPDKEQRRTRDDEQEQRARYSFQRLPQHGAVQHYRQEKEPQGRENPDVENHEQGVMVARIERDKRRVTLERLDQEPGSSKEQDEQQNGQHQPGQAGEAASPCARSLRLLVRVPPWMRSKGVRWWGIRL